MNDESKRGIDIRQTTEYRQGYQEGFNKALEMYQEQVQKVFLSQPIQYVVKVDQEEFDRIKRDIDFKESADK